MMRFLGRRALHSALALFALISLVFFLVRLTGDPASLYLPIDASVVLGIWLVALPSLRRLPLSP